jgi:hypothetical protein
LQQQHSKTPLLPICIHTRKSMFQKRLNHSQQNPTFFNYRIPFRRSQFQITFLKSLQRILAIGPVWLSVQNWPNLSNFQFMIFEWIETIFFEFQRRSPGFQAGDVQSTVGCLGQQKFAESEENLSSDGYDVLE